MTMVTTTRSPMTTRIITTITTTIIRHTRTPTTRSARPR
jgi:hypothetical protein